MSSLLAQAVQELRDAVTANTIISLLRNAFSNLREKESLSYMLPHGKVATLQYHHRPRTEKVGCACPRVPRAGGEYSSRFHSLRHEGSFHACILQVQKQRDGRRYLSALRGRVCIREAAQVLETNWLSCPYYYWWSYTREYCWWNHWATIGWAYGLGGPHSWRLPRGLDVQQRNWLDLSHRNPGARDQCLRLTHQNGQHGVFIERSLVEALKSEHFARG